MVTQNINNNKKTLKTIAILGAIVLLIGVALGAFFVGRATADSNKSSDNHIVHSDQYYIYVGFGTLPILYESLHMLSHDTQSYAFFGRKDTYDVNQLPKHVKMISDKTQIVDAVVELVAQLNQQNDKAKFHFFVDDLRVVLPYWAFYSNGITEDRFDITLLADGTATYDTRPGFMLGDLLGPNGHENWTRYSREFLDMLTRFKDNSPINDEEYDLLNQKYSYIVSQRPNVEYWMQYPEFIFLYSNVSPEMQAEFMRANLVKKQPYSILSTIGNERRELFFGATLNNPSHPGGAVKDKLDQMFDNPAKPILLISATHVGGGIPPADFDDAVLAAVEKFGGDYTIMIKPHPEQDINASYFDITRQRGIEILPPQLPMETIMWAYPSVLVGGYQSTLYLNASPSQVLFFFSNDFANGGLNHEVLVWLYQKGFFPNADYVNRV